MKPEQTIFWLDGERFSSGTTREEVQAWPNSPGLISNTAAEVGVFNFDTHTVLLNSGYEMPINGPGTYSLHGDECRNSVRSALESGVRLIDTASAYGNEEEIGEAIRQAIEDGIRKTI